MLKLDLHIHSMYSEDAEGSPKELMKIIQKKGLQGMALTDHNTVDGVVHAQKHVEKNFIFIPGIEISTKDGHLLALNITEVIPRGLSVEETIDLIIDKGGTPIVPHVYRNMSGIKLTQLKKIASKLKAIEVFNGCSMPTTNLRMAQTAAALHLGGTGGSDSHIPQYAGEAYTTVETTDVSVEGVIQAIHQKKTWGEGTTMPLDYRQDRMVTSIKQFFQRGLRRI